MKVLVLNLPLPPSTNKLYANVPGKGRVRTREYKRWSIAALNYSWLSKPQGGFPFFDGAFEMQITLPLKMRGDITNRIKAVEDWLKKPAGIVADDKHTHTATVARGSDVEPGFCRVFVFETKEAA